MTSVWFVIIATVVIAISLVLWGRYGSKPKKVIEDPTSQRPDVSPPSQFPPPPPPFKATSSLTSEEYQNIVKLINKMEGNLVVMSAGLEKIPAKTLNTIQGSVNSTTGKLGELMTFIELQRAYDRLMTVGNIVDFIGIRFPTETLPGAIDFIDVKTGDKAVLNPDQKKLKTMIEKSKECVSFKIVKVELV